MPSDFQPSIRWGIVKLILFAINGCFVLFTCCIFTVTLAKWILSQRVHFESSLNFIFDPCVDGSVCSFPTANISIPEDLLMRENAYDINVGLQVIDCELNRNIPIVQLMLRFIDERETVVKILVKSVSLPHKSWYIRTIHTLFFLPFYLLGIQSEVLQLKINFDEGYVHILQSHILKVQIHIQSTKLIISDSHLFMDAKVGIFRRLLYSFPFAVYFIIFIISFGFLTGLSVIYWTGKSAIGIIAILDQYERQKSQEPKTSIRKIPLPNLSNNSVKKIEKLKSRPSNYSLPNLDSPLALKKSVSNAFNPLNE